MTANVLEKIEGTVFKATLEYKKNMRKRFVERGLEKEAREVQTSIAGYVQALRDADIITEGERQTLYIYYGTI